ncbi:MAG: proteasome accessory factor [Actinomycetota bacterium]|jgi:proteasome accessory factor B|nr:proteasome accessory factor [Actinomycetota bacterium]
MSARKTERLLNLVICLLATRRYLAAEQIRRTVAGYEELGDEAFKRKFERDKEDLRDLGIPLETGSDSPFDDEPGYRIRRDDYSLPEITFEPAELAVLGVAARTWQHASLGGAASEAVLKLRAAGVDIDDAVPFAIETRVATSEPAFEPLRRAAADRRPVKFDYRTPGATRHVEPWGLVCWHGRWYLAAYDCDRADTRVFRVSRITGAVTPDGPPGSVTVPEGTDVRQIVLRMNQDTDRLTATLRVREGAAFGLRRRASSVRALEPGWDLIEIAVPHVERLADEAVTYGADVVIVDPPEARAAVLSRLRAVLR